jgi:hypothetical protein
MDNMDVGQIATDATEEKLIPQSHVDKIVHRTKAEVAERMTREFDQRMQQQQAPQAAASQANPEEIESRIMQKLQEKQQQEQNDLIQKQRQQAAETVALQYFDKMHKGKEAFPDLDEIMGDFEPQAFPEVVFLAAETENTPAVMRELVQNPAKLTAIHAAAKVSEKMARKMMKDLSDSIAKNEKAQAENVTAQPPLSRQKPSPGAGVAAGKQSFKGASWLRG